MTDPVHFSLPGPLVYSIASLGVLLLACYLVYLTLPEDKDETALSRLRDRLGLKGLHLVPFMAFATFWGALVAVLGIGLFGMVIEIIAHAIPTRRIPATVWDFRFKLIQITALTTVLGAVIALPITVIRLRLTKKQTDAVTESLFNEKINAATAGLYARRQVTEWKRKDGYVHVWQDDIVQRNAAIDRLEGLARENNVETPRIARLLSVYVRELSRLFPPKAVPHGEAFPKIQEWARKLQPIRSDLEKAVQVLGCLHDISPMPLDSGEIDLRGANLQGFDLSGLNFSFGQFSNADMQGTNFKRTLLKKSQFSNARLQGAELTESNLQSADMNGADLTTAVLMNAKLDGANLRFSDLSYAGFHFATLRGASLNSAKFNDSKLQEVNFDNADLEHIRMTDCFLFLCSFANANLKRALFSSNHFYNTNLSKARLQETDFKFIEFNNCDLKHSYLDDTKFVNSRFDGCDFGMSTFLFTSRFSKCGIQNSDLGKCITQPNWHSGIVGDESVGRPKGAASANAVRPDHWSPEVLTKDAFDTHLREWQATQPPGSDA